MTIKISSNLKELMDRKGLRIQELRERTGLPHIAILNACSEKIEYCGLNVLSKIASAMGVPIKDLFEEQIPSAIKPVSRRGTAGETNISSVTEQLISIIMKLSTTDKDKLNEKYNELRKTPAAKSDISNVTTNLVDLIMTMSLEERCKLLGDFISYSGQTKRKFTRKEYFRPVPFTVNGKLYHGSTRNISMGGAFIEIKDAKNQFAIGDTIKMNIEHPETYQHFNINGKIVRIAKAGIGVCFEESL
jgi:transcriptional regulator with XRE-family HTH domain